MNFLMEQVFNKPHLLEHSRAQMIFNVLAPRFGIDLKEVQHFDKTAALFGEFQTDPNEVSLIDGVAIIPILGTLVHRKMNVSPMSGKLLSYQEIAAMIIEASEDSQVKSILLDISSGGGQADSAFDLARTVREIDQTKKPVFAIANSAAFSAAYAIAAGARKIFVSETGGVGSVGVFAEHIDFSKHNEMSGIKVTLIKSGGLKAERSPDFPLSSEAEERLQKEVDQIYSIFVGMIAEMRGLTAEAVVGSQAGLFFGADAVKAGFADEVATFDEAVESILQLNQEQVTIGQTSQMNQTGDDSMKLFSKDKEKLQKKAKEASAEEQEGSEEEVSKDAAKEQEGSEEEVSKDVVEKQEDIAARAADITELAVKAGCAELAPQMIRDGLSIEEATEKLQLTERITALCTRAGKSDMTVSFLKDKLTVVEVQDKLIDLLAEEAKDTDISTKVSADAIEQDKVVKYAEGDQDNALVAGAKKMREQANQSK